MKRFWEIKDFGLCRLPTRATALQEVKILPIFVYSYFLWIKIYLGLFKGCFTLILPSRAVWG